jgi:hypothetical protein
MTQLDSDMSSSPTFHPFPRLPNETQIQIWELATLCQQIIAFSPRRYNADGVPIFYHSRGHRQPAILAACHLSRTIGLKHYQIIPLTNILNQPIYVCLSRDILYFDATVVKKTFFSSFGAPPSFGNFFKVYITGPNANCGIRSVVFETEFSLDTMVSCIRNALDRWTFGFDLTVTHGPKRTGIYCCGKCKVDVSPQAYGMKFQWTRKEVARNVDRKTGVCKTKKHLEVKILRRWEINREFGDGPWNKGCCPGYELHQEGFSSDSGRRY